MKPIENIIKNFDIEIDSKTDEIKCKELLQAQENSKRPAAIFTKHKMAIFSAAAVVLIAAIPAVIFLSSQNPVEQIPPQPAPPEPEVIHRAPAMATMGIQLVDREKVEEEKNAINEMAENGDIDGLVLMLETGMYQSKVLAAEHLEKIGDDTALPMLAELNKWHGDWMLGDKCVSVYHNGSRNSGIFAQAMCTILTRDLPPHEQIEAWFDILEARGPIAPVIDALFMPNGAGPVWRPKDGDLAMLFPDAELKCGFDVAKRVGAKLSEFDDPSIAERLRSFDNKGSAIYAVWTEVRDMPTEDALQRCMEIVRTESPAMQYGAIHCLSELFGKPAIDALDELGYEGYVEAIVAFDDYHYNPEVLKILCWHLTDNQHSPVRLKIILPDLFKSVNFWRERQPEFISAMVTALYDPNEQIRRRSATSLKRIANSKNSALVAEFEEDLLFALKHPDEQIRPIVLQALKNIGSERIDEEKPNGLPIRTDIAE